MLHRWFLHWFLDPEEFTGELHFTKWHSRLDHAPGAGVHAQQQGSYARPCVSLQIVLV